MKHEEYQPKEYVLFGLDTSSNKKVKEEKTMRHEKYPPIVYVIFGLLLIIGYYTNKLETEKQILMQDTLKAKKEIRELKYTNDSLTTQLKNKNQQW